VLNRLLRGAGPKILERAGDVLYRVDGLERGTFEWAVEKASRQRVYTERVGETDGAAKLIGCERRDIVDLALPRVVLQVGRKQCRSRID
jgi:hypothetical protein